MIMGKKVIYQIPKHFFRHSLSSFQTNYSYKRRGVIKPIPERIWDNRFMAFEEGAKNSNLNYTTFEIVSGSGFYPGMLIRETKYASGM